MQAWLLDVYPVENGMRVWVVDAEGRPASFIDKWSPLFYLTGPVPRSLGEGGRRVEKTEFFSRQPRSVLEVRVRSPLAYHRVVKKLLSLEGPTLFNADINLGQCYFYERGLFPLARFSYEVDNDGFLRDYHLEDSPWELDYPLPPLRYAHLGLESGDDPHNDSTHVKASHRRRGRFILSFDKTLGSGKTVVMDGSEEDLIRSLNHHLAEWDPDILLTDWGDGYLLQKLRLHSRNCGVPLRLSRDTTRPAPRSLGEGGSFFSYGKIIHKDSPAALFGRLHIDVKNSFTVHHTEMDGLFEIARVAKIPLQRAARSTIGTALSSLQFEWAGRNHVLIPVDKGQTEDFRPADELINSDRGGLVYEPVKGWFEDVIEYDFASMYPEIMIRKNVTPEAVNCPCCPHNRVPGISHHLCEKRGMIPDVLEPIVKKRGAYKKLIKEGHPKAKAFKARYDAFKWALVTCFGYLGFRNARFGRIEAHECVNAYSRETLLRAKEIAEAAGFRMLHAIVDSLWLQKPGTTDEEVERLRLSIEQATGLPLGLEGRYRWIRFCPSRVNARSGVPNRYFGAFTTGETKVRGLELRRHDTPLFIKELQEKILRKLSSARNLNELGSLEKDVAEITMEFQERLKTGDLSALELAFTLRLSKDPALYVNDTLSAVAAKKMQASGIALSAGEIIQYVVADEKSPVKDWRVLPLALIEEAFEYDPAYYKRIMERALEVFHYF